MNAILRPARPSRRFGMACAVLLLAAGAVPAVAWDEHVHQQITAGVVDAWPAAGTATASADAVIVPWAVGLACAARPWPWHAADATAAALITLAWNDELAMPPWMAPPIAVHPADLVILGSSAPDRDGRNQARVARGADGRPMLEADGRQRAIDPLIRQFGAPTGLGSQAHAHYALPPRTAAGLLAWWIDPATAGWDLAGIGSLSAEAGAQAEIHVAVANRLRTADPRSAAWAIGGALHYLQDAADPLHNVQAGPRSMLRHALVGAVLGLRSPIDTGMAGLRNLHLGAEALQAAWLFEGGPEIGRAEFAEARRRGVAGATFPPLGPAVWVDLLATAGARDGLIAYDRMARVIEPRFARGLADVGESLDPVTGWRAILDPGRDPAALRELGEVLGRATGRAEAATAELVRRWLAARLVADERVAADRLTAQQVRWTARHGESAAPTPWCEPRP